MKVLIVEDNRQMRETIRFCLQNLSHEFCECSDGTDALSNFEIFKPDWVLMDWEMKRMDGITATKKIIKKFPKAKICFVTGYNDAELKMAALKAGAAGYVIKDDLSRLRKILEVR